MLALLKTYLHMLAISSNKYLGEIEQPIEFSRNFEGPRSGMQTPIGKQSASCSTNFSKARDLKLSTTGARFPLRTAIAISSIGILSAISQATTEATLRLTIDEGAMVTPVPESTSEISVAVSPAVWRTFRPEFDQQPDESR